MAPTVGDVYLLSISEQIGTRVGITQINEFSGTEWFTEV